MSIVVGTRGAKEMERRWYSTYHIHIIVSAFRRRSWKLLAAENEGTCGALYLANLLANGAHVESARVLLLSIVSSPITDPACSIWQNTRRTMERGQGLEWGLRDPEGEE